MMCPGGGYTHLAAGHEGHDMAPWFNARGITYAVLEYRMPAGNREIPFEDAEQGMRILKANAQKWGGDPARVGIAGASAGAAVSRGHGGCAAYGFRLPSRIPDSFLSCHLHAGGCDPSGLAAESSRRESGCRVGEEIQSSELG